MSALEQLAIALVFILSGAGYFIISWALRLKNEAEKKAEREALKRVHLEVMNDIKNKSISDLVDESNKRHGL